MPQYDLIGNKSVVEFEIQVDQNLPDSTKKSYGRFTVVCLGEGMSRENIHIGSYIEVIGSLWFRKFKNRMGRMQESVKILANSISISDSALVSGLSSTKIFLSLE